MILGNIYYYSFWVGVGFFVYVTSLIAVRAITFWALSIQRFKSTNFAVDILTDDATNETHLPIITDQSSVRTDDLSTPSIKVSSILKRRIIINDPIKPLHQYSVQSVI
jgi:hypothetical protein